MHYYPNKGKKPREKTLDILEIIGENVQPCKKFLGYFSNSLVRATFIAWLQDILFLPI